MRKTLVLFSILYFLFSNPTFAEEVTVTASIGDNRVTIFGYTAPSSKVELTSQNVYDVTYSDPTGHFIFDKSLLPKNPGELCLSSLDDSGRRSSPTCIPAPPATNYHTDIGPIILPPTITLDTDTVDPNSTTIASGQSIPESTIEIHFYQVSDKAQPFVKPVQAFSLPIFETKSDKSGNYSFNIPTSYQSNYRLYSTAKYNDNFSPKSNTLTYNLPITTNYWLYISISLLILTLLPFLYFLYIYFLPVHHYYPAVFSYPLAKIN